MAMSRRQELENIIIGTLLESTMEESYYYDVKSCITEDMIQDGMNKRIFRMVSEMNAKGKKETTPTAILEEYGEAVMDILPDIVDKAVDNSFVWLKCKHNEEQYLSSLETGYKPKYTYVEFSDYVGAFIKLYNEEEYNIKRVNNVAS